MSLETDVTELRRRVTTLEGWNRAHQTAMVELNDQVKALTTAVALLAGFAPAAEALAQVGKEAR